MDHGLEPDRHIFGHFEEECMPTVASVIQVDCYTFPGLCNIFRNHSRCLSALSYFR